MQEEHDLMQMMAFGAVAKNPLPFSNTPRNDNHEEVFRIFGFILRNFCSLAMFHLSKGVARKNYPGGGRT